MRSRRGVSLLGETEDAADLHYGMSLRDYFAAQALTGILSVDEEYLVGDNFDHSTPYEEAHDFATQAAKAAYRVADAMLKVRSGEAE